MNKKRKKTFFASMLTAALDNTLSLPSPASTVSV